MKVITTRKFLERNYYVKELELGMLQVVVELLSGLKRYKLFGIINTNLNVLLKNC
jgi:hypothetical protein